MNRKTTVVTAFAAAALSLGVLAAPAQAADKQVDTRVLVSNCFNCHGTNGNSVGVIDELASLPARRIVKAMKQYAAGNKSATIMDRIARGYTEAEVQAMADYIQKVNE